jgi:hypothetical protein
MPLLPQNTSAYQLDGFCQFLFLIVEDKDDLPPEKVAQKRHERLGDLRVVRFRASKRRKAHFVRDLRVGTELQKRQCTFYEHCIGIMNINDTYIKVRLARWRLSEACE